MVFIRLQCFVTLTVIALSLAARVSGADKPQPHGLDTLLSTNQLRSRRRWPARLLASGPSAPLLEKLTHAPVGKWISQQTGLLHASTTENSVTSSFHSLNIKKVNAAKFFDDPKVKAWQKSISSKSQTDSDALIFSTLYAELKASDNGGVEAIVAQAVRNKDTRAIGRRFEELLLGKLSAGVANGDAVETGNYLRYVLYRNAKRDSVNEDMKTKLGEPFFTAQINKFKETIYKSEQTPSQHLENYFTMLSGGRKIADVFNDWRPVEGFDNNIFLFNQLLAEKNRLNINKTFAEFMLDTLRKEDGFSLATTALHLKQLQEHKISEGLRKFLVDPLYKMVSTQLARSHP